MKRIIYSIAFIWLCYLDHIIGSATGYWQYALKNYTGVVIGIIILTAYSIKDFLKVPYAIWGIVFFAGRAAALHWAEGNVASYERFEAVVWNIGIYGLIWIRMLYGWFIEKKKKAMNWAAFGLWLSMMAGMILIRWDVVWPRFFLLFFSSLYLTDFSQKDLETLFTGMIEGIIIGFIILQGYACMYRPYDMLRYEGMYSNANINALFYLTVYAAVMCKWYQMKRRNRPLMLRIPILALAGILISLTIFTMGRIAMIGFFFVTILLLFFQTLGKESNSFKKKFKVCIADAIMIIASVLICFVPTYYAVRYIPAYVDEPLFFEADSGKMDSKVQKGEALDSPKYIRLDRVLKGSFGRFFWFLKAEEKQSAASGGNSLGTTMVVHAAEWEENVRMDEAPEAISVEPGTDKEHPILTSAADIKNPVKIRTSIYLYYLKHLKLFGQRDGVSQVWVTADYSAPHAHNLFLYIAGEFGAVIGLLFLIMVVWLYKEALWGIRKVPWEEGHYRSFVLVSFVTVLVTFGMLEICWVYGQLPFTLFFMVQYLFFSQNVTIQSHANL